MLTPEPGTPPIGIQESEGGIISPPPTRYASRSVLLKSKSWVAGATIVLEGTIGKDGSRLSYLQSPLAGPIGHSLELLSTAYRGAYT